jgi:hypothetical protein
VNVPVNVNAPGRYSSNKIVNISPVARQQLYTLSAESSGAVARVRSRLRARARARWDGANPKASDCYPLRGFPSISRPFGYLPLFPSTAPRNP